MKDQEVTVSEKSDKQILSEQLFKIFAFLIVIIGAAITTFSMLV